MSGRDIFTRRGIPFEGEVFEARGYAEYEAGDVDTVYDLCEELTDRKTGRRLNRRWVGRFTKTHGWIIPKHKAFPHLPDIRPQLRPDEAVVDTGKGDRGMWTHDHDKKFVDSDGEPMGEIACKEHLRSTKWKKDHTTKTGRTIHKDKIHTHVFKAKYGFAPVGAAAYLDEGDLLLPDQEADRERELQRREEAWKAAVDDLERAKELVARHQQRIEGDPHLRNLAEAMVAGFEKKARQQREARRGTRFKQTDVARLDVNPLNDWSQSGPGFLGIESSFKADAMLHWLRENGWAPKTADVPSVSTCDAPELALFAKVYMQDDPIFIVPDADWSTKSEVLYHALNVQVYLSRVCGVDAHVAAPPVGKDNGTCPDCGASDQLFGVECSECGEVAKGVDDWLGSFGGALDRLEVLDFRSKDFKAWVEDYRGSRKGKGFERATTEFDITVARTLARTAFPDEDGVGVGLRSVAAISRAIFGHGLTLEEAMERSIAEPRVRGWDNPFYTTIRRHNQDFTDNQRRNVADALARLEGKAFTSTGVFPEWIKTHWETDPRTGRRYRKPAHMEARIEYVTLDPRLSPKATRTTVAAVLTAPSAARRIPRVELEPRKVYSLLMSDAAAKEFAKNVLKLQEHYGVGTVGEVLERVMKEWKEAEKGSPAKKGPAADDLA